MKPSVAVPAAIGVGYILGRTRKLRLAMMLVAAAVAGKFAGQITEMAQRGIGSLTGSGGLEQVTKPGGQMLEAAKGAAIAALSSRLDSLTERLSAPSADQLTEPVSKLAGDKQRQDEEEGEEGEQEEQEEEQPEPPRGRGGRQAPSRRQAPGQGRASSREEAEEDEDYEDEDEAEDEDEEEPAKPVQRSRGGRTPVRRNR